ncbi:uncharacterized protein LOC133823209 isoform X2 [Humulus lupulus]|uniref:uncharacterized protein LOC133823209 isoform X2 n=1 Tax=Humulus lupulus TaxID=3486 RepID=UPI002B4180A0|nr:uncharacterized protein LOC133823209 isoform X2 [Humulus lupulus]
MASPSSLRLDIFLSSVNRRYHPPVTFSSISAHLKTQSIPSQQNTLKFPPYSNSFRIFYRLSPSDDDDEDDAEYSSFDEAVELFNKREYYKCHDFLEALWNRAEEPSRTLIHGILQCTVGFHHLFNQNHKGAMMELGEGLCKLRKMNFKNGPFHQFEQEISSVLDFIYQTQIELAACSDDMCVAMDQSERSYQLLGGYAAGQHLYKLQSDSNGQTIHIVFSPHMSYANGEPQRVKLPTLNATTELLEACDYY